MLFFHDCGISVILSIIFNKQVLLNVLLTLTEWSCRKVTLEMFTVAGIIRNLNILPL